MHLLLFILYSLVCLYALTRIPFFRNSGIRPGILLTYFGLRVTVGCLHNWIAYRYYPNHGDVWRFFNNSLVQRRELFTDLNAFLRDNSTLAYLSHNVIEWMHMLLNFLSFDNLYINTLLFSFLALGGIIALFRVFRIRFGEDPLTACCVLLLPSTLFWTSCIHTEGLEYALLGWLFYYLDRLLRRPVAGDSAPRPTRPFTRPVLGCLCLFALAVFFRPALLVSLLPAIFFWILTEKVFFSKQYEALSQPLARPVSRRVPKLLLPATTVALLLLLPLCIPSVSTAILHYFCSRQSEFQLLTGNSRIYLPVLEPSWTSFGRIFPIAALNGLFQPLPGSGGQSIYKVFSIELILLWLIIIYSLLRLIWPARSALHPSLPGSIHRDSSPCFPPAPTFSSFGISCLIFSLSGMLLIGYIIPFVGSIIRYRSIYLPFLLAPFLHTLRSLHITAILNKWLKKHIVESSKH